MTAAVGEYDGVETPMIGMNFERSWNLVGGEAARISALSSAEWAAGLGLKLGMGVGLRIAF